MKSILLGILLITLVGCANTEDVLVRDDGVVQEFGSTRSGTDSFVICKFGTWKYIEDSDEAAEWLKVGDSLRLIKVLNENKQVSRLRIERKK